MACCKSTLLLLTIFVSTGFCLHDFHNIKPRVISYPKLNEKPLMLTPFLENGSIAEARRLSKVYPAPVGNVTSYSGFFTVSKTYNSNMFFWFFPAEIQPDNAPVVVWLQGGPGASSLYGLLAENGPFQVGDDLTNVTLREYTWTKHFSMLYIDNPVGTGYSFTNHEEGYATTQTDVGQNLYNAATQFFQLFPELQKNDFFLTGESYAGKYIPAFAYTIHQKNQNSQKPKINLKGLAIGNGLCDPKHQLNYGDLLYQIGLIDWNAKRLFDEGQAKIVALIEKENYYEAFKIYDSLLNGDLINTSTLFTNVTGFTNYYNFLHPHSTPPGEVLNYVQQASIRKLIHVGDSPFGTGNKVEMHLINDIMKSVVLYIEILIENYKVLFYNGQLDIIVGYPLTEEFLKNLNWSGADEYRVADRHIWKVGDEIAGYHKTVKNLTEVMMRNSGHMVPTEKPSFTYEMITRFVFGKQFL